MIILYVRIPMVYVYILHNKFDQKLLDYCVTVTHVYSTKKMCKNIAHIFLALL
jgi:hypothetical protein